MKLKRWIVTFEINDLPEKGDPFASEDLIIKDVNAGILELNKKLALGCDVDFESLNVQEIE